MLHQSNIFLMHVLRYYSRVYAYYYVAGMKMLRCGVFHQCVDFNVNFFNVQTKTVIIVYYANHVDYLSICI